MKGLVQLSGKASGKHEQGPDFNPKYYLEQKKKKEEILKNNYIVNSHVPSQ